MHEIENLDGSARLRVGGRIFDFPGRWITGGRWERFGLYDHYVVVRADGAVLEIPAHAGELVPGSTEDLIAVVQRYDFEVRRPPAPMAIEVDPTYACASRDCGGRCFSAAYRQSAPRAAISTDILRSLLTDFAVEGGRVVRFDGGGDPLAHPAVRSGEIPELANSLGLRSTILTSGDLLALTDLPRIGQADCYLRVSLNAATDATRRKFHGNSVSLQEIFAALHRFAGWLQQENPTLPIGATFLLDVANHHEVLDCARRARDVGISHFSVRRVLGPRSLRPEFSPRQKEAAADQLERVRELAGETFRVFLPWRSVDEPDLNPASGAFQAARCWQSTFKTVIEPDPVAGGFRAQLCGRYRGSGHGQQMQMLPLFSSLDGAGWTDRWRRSFAEYGISREALPRTCVSCIDRGYILMLDRLVGFLGTSSRDFTIFHLQRDDRSEGRAALPHRERNLDPPPPDVSPVPGIDLP